MGKREEKPLGVSHSPVKALHPISWEMRPWATPRLATRWHHPEAELWARRGARTQPLSGGSHSR